MSRIGAVFILRQIYRLHHMGCHKSALSMMERLSRYVVPNEGEEIPFPFSLKESRGGSKQKKPPVYQSKKKPKKKGGRRRKNRGNRHYHNRSGRR